MDPLSLLVEKLDGIFQWKQKFFVSPAIGSDPDGRLAQSLEGQMGTVHLETLVSGTENITLGPHCFRCSSKCIWRLLGCLDLPLCLLEKDWDFLVGGGMGREERETNRHWVCGEQQEGRGSSLKQSRKS